MEVRALASALRGGRTRVFQFFSWNLIVFTFLGIGFGFDRSKVSRSAKRNVCCARRLQTLQVAVSSFTILSDVLSLGTFLKTIFVAYNLPVQ